MEALFQLVKALGMLAALITTIAVICWVTVAGVMMLPAGIIILLACFGTINIMKDM